MEDIVYKEDFFSMHLNNSLSSAKEIVPVIKSYIQPASVIDIGCGIGTWLKVWKESGVSTILGVDGDYVKKEQLLIPPELFVSHDLSKPYVTTAKYDLVTCLEVGEHLHASAAEVFVSSLCRLGDIILFSAAIPGQGGTYHFNEQYPAYWDTLFARQGFISVDCLRSQIWGNNKISWWYRQNILFFVKQEILSTYPALDKEYKRTEGKLMPLVHPELLQLRVNEINYLNKILRNPLRIIVYYVKKILKR